MEKRKLFLYIAESLDGFIATEDEDLSWLLSVEGEGDNGYNEFFDTVDTVLMGRVTYDWIMEHENGNFPYRGKESYVFSRTKKTDNEFVKFFDGDISTLIQSLKEKDGKNIWLVGGGKLLHKFLEEKLVDEIIISVAPVLLGKGIPLFLPQNDEMKLKLKRIRQFNQFAELSYEVIK